MGYKFLPQHTSVTNGCKQMQQLCMVFVHMWMGVVGASKPQHPVRAVDTQVLWVTGGSGGALSSTGVNSWRMCINSCCCGISLRNGPAVWPPLRANGGCWSWGMGCVVVPLCLSVVVDCCRVAVPATVGLLPCTLVPFLQTLLLPALLQLVVRCTNAVLCYAMLCSADLLLQSFGLVCRRPAFTSCDGGGAQLEQQGCCGRVCLPGWCHSCLPGCWDRNRC